MNPIKTNAIKVKNHIVKHRGKYAAGAVAFAAIAIQRKHFKMFDEFLIEKGIDPKEYWLAEFYEELNA